MEKDNVVDFSVFKRPQKPLERVTLNLCWNGGKGPRDVAQRVGDDLQRRARRVTLADHNNPETPDTLNAIAGEESTMPDDSKVYGLREARQDGYNEAVSVITQKVEAMFTAIDLQLRQRGKEDDADTVRRHAVQNFRALCQTEGWAP